MSNYTHRERVIATINHKEADRIPIDLIGNATMLLDDPYIKLHNHLGLSSIPPFRSGTTANYYDERILEYFDVDFRRIFLQKNPNSKSVKIDEDSFIDPWGITYKKLDGLVNAVNHPLENAQTVEDIEPEKLIAAFETAREYGKYY
ncbi:MAG: hypothetical protein ABFS12_04870 [Bacteroidota bacterium]